MNKLIITAVFILASSAAFACDCEHSADGKQCMSGQKHSGAEGHNMVMAKHDGDSSHTMAASETSAAAMPHGNGKVISVDVQNKAIKLTHEPIKELNWPKMTMNFNVEDGVDISSYQSGDEVSFTLKPSGDDYVITEMKKAK